MILQVKGGRFLGAGFLYVRAGFYLLFRAMEVHFSRDDCIGKISPTMKSWGDPAKDKRPVKREPPLTPVKREPLGKFCLASPRPAQQRNCIVGPTRDILLARAWQGASWKKWRY